MVDVLLMYALIKAIPDKAALLMVGDVDQLPSVGPGQILADVIASEVSQCALSFPLQRTGPSIPRQLTSWLPHSRMRGNL
jgi:ATP-dependent exoDNAse (exonuclease V) alpha subunit